MTVRDVHNAVVVPLDGKSWVSNLPHEILAKDIPRSAPDPDPRGGRAAGGLFKGRLVIDAGHPAVPWRFSMQDTYDIKQAGDYTLVVGVAIYNYAKDQQSVIRLDLPPVTVHLHLAASQK